MLHKSIIIIVLSLFVTLNNISILKADNSLQIEDLRGFPKSLQNEKFDLRAINPKYKLPEPVIPYHYDLKVIPILIEDIPNRQRWTVYGSVRIFVQCFESTSEIVIHKSPDLNITHDNIAVLTAGSSSIPVPVLPAIDFDEEKEFYSIKLASELQIGTNYSVYIEYTAPIYTNGRLDGMYRSSYTNSTGFTSYLATTQFQPTDFRRLVPSFDEPNLKATFDISVGYLPTKYVTLSNSAKVAGTNPPIDAEGFEGWVWDIYQRTVVTSTYIIAIIITEDYSYVEAGSELYPKPVRTYGPSELIARGGGDFAARTAANQLAYFRDYFEIDYPMHKMDSIAIPDFSAGAMENWGLNTYRIPYLLHFPGETTESERGLISNILAHELGHQWFGNPVTCANWTNLWLNEGFATYVSYLGWEATDPEFQPRKFFMNDAFQYSLIRDSSAATSHPMVNDGITPDEINRYFTPITYEKGGSVIRMMEGFLGQETFRKGLVRYLNDMYFKGALQDDLWRNLNEVAAEENALPEGVTMKEIMDTWTLQAGHPIVRVSVATSNLIYISQERVFPNNPTDLDPNHLWYVPVAVATPEDPNFSTFVPKFWIEPNVALKSYAINTDQWIVINPSATGYYRVLYDMKLRNLLLAQLDRDHEIFSPESRSQFLDDFFNLAFQKHVFIEAALEFTKYLHKETERIVWGAALTNLRNSFNKLRETEAFEEFKNYLVPKLNATLHEIGFQQPETESGATVIMRATLLDWACAMDSPDCITYATDLLKQWMLTPDTNPVPSDIQAVVYCAGVRNGDADVFQFIFQRYDAAVVGTQKTRLLNALVCYADLTLIETDLLSQVTAQPSRLTDADRVNALNRVATLSSLQARTLTVNFLDTRLERLKELGAVLLPLRSLVANIGTAGERTLVETFINSNRESLAEIEGLDLDELLAIIDRNIIWRQEYEEPMRNWFVNNNSK